MALLFGISQRYKYGHDLEKEKKIKMIIINDKWQNFCSGSRDGMNIVMGGLWMARNMKKDDSR